MNNTNDDLSNLMCLDIFLSSLSVEDNHQVARNITIKNTFPVMSWDFSGNHLSNFQHHRIIKDKAHLNKFSKYYNWQIDIEKTLDKPYDALVLTDATEDIIWVNDGFKKMTGYESNYAIGRKPNFLQGVKTSKETRWEIKNDLLRKTPFTAVIVNYKKNNEKYLCEINVIPIINQQNEITHFISLERAI